MRRRGARNDHSIEVSYSPARHSTSLFSMYGVPPHTAVLDTSSRTRRNGFRLFPHRGDIVATVRSSGLPGLLRLSFQSMLLSLTRALCNCAFVLPTEHPSIAEISR